MSEEAPDEVQMAIAARVRYALRLLEAGDTERAKTQLRSLDRLLPAHERRHHEAVKAH